MIGSEKEVGEEGFDWRQPSGNKKFFSSTLVVYPSRQIIRKSLFMESRNEGKSENPVQEPENLHLEVLLASVWNYTFPTVSFLIALTTGD